VKGHSRANMLYDPSHYVLQHLDYLDHIDIYHERIKMFHVKDAELNPTGRQGVYGGFQSWVNRAGRFRSPGDGQVDFGGIFSKLTQHNVDGGAVVEWECCLKHPEDGAREGAAFVDAHIIRVTEKAFDDFADAGTDRAANRRIADTPSRLTGIVLCDVCQKPMWQVRNEDGSRRDAWHDKRKNAPYHYTRRPKFYCQPNHPGGSVGTNRVMEALQIAIADLAAQDLANIPDDDGDRAAQLAAQLAAHDAAIAKHQRGLRLADDAFVGGVMDLDRYKTQVDRLRSLIELEQSAKTTLEAAADAAKQRGSRADMLREVAASGPAMLATEDTAAANAWLRRYVRVLVRDNQVTDVVFNFW
jgi:hypothetical protein